MHQMEHALAFITKCAACGHGEFVATSGREVCDPDIVRADAVASLAGVGERHAGQACASRGIAPGQLVDDQFEHGGRYGSAALPVACSTG